MIIINAIEEDGCIRPERNLTDEERLTVTSTLSNGTHYIHYQGDEPEIENIEE
jgi:hypothetical protein